MKVERQYDYFDLVIHKQITLRYMGNDPLFTHRTGGGFWRERLWIRLIP